MSFSVTMPALGESVTEGTVTRWLKSEGDFVKVDEPLLEVSTDKVDTEIPSPAEGILTRIVVPVDSTVAVGAELAVIGDGGSAAAPAPVASPVEAPVAAPVAPVTPVVETPAPVAAPVAPVTTGSAAGVVVTMPALGESVTEGTVTRWLKNVGDTINVDEPLLEVSTDKVDTEIPSPASGTILAIDVAVDSTVAVGARLALIGAAGAAPVAAAPAAPVAPVVATPVEPVVAAPVAPVAPVVSTPAPAAPAPTSVPALDDSYVTPIVRKLAHELGVELSSVKGTGIGGRIRKEDVQAAAKPVASAASVVAPASNSSAPKAAPVAVSPLRGTTVTMSRLRKVIAARMVESQIGRAHV